MIIASTHGGLKSNEQNNNVYNTVLDQTGKVIFTVQKEIVTQS